MKTHDLDTQVHVDDSDSVGPFLVGAVMGVVVGALLGALAARRSSTSLAGVIARVPGKKSTDEPRFELLLQ